MTPNISRIQSITPDIASPINSALFYANRGWPVFPLVPGTKFPLRGLHWAQEATTATDQICIWWQKYPKANLAIITGQRSGLVVIDVDVKKAARGIESLNKMADFDIDSVQLSACTPSGGFHLFYTMPAGMTIGNSASKIGSGIDVRATGGYMVAPPSKTRNGSYEWGYDGDEFPLELPPLPKCFIDLLHPQVVVQRPITTIAMPFGISPRIAPIIEDRLRAIEIAPKGTRNDTLNRHAFYLARYAKSGTIPVPDLLSLLLQAALNAGLADSDALKTIQSGLQQGLRS